MGELSELDLQIFQKQVFQKVLFSSLWIIFVRNYMSRFDLKFGFWSSRHEMWLRDLLNFIIEKQRNPIVSYLPQDMSHRRDRYHSGETCNAML